MTLNDFKVGDRVQISPACDRWMMGDKYGEVIRIGRRLLRLKMDRSGHLVDMVPDRIHEILERSSNGN